MNDDNAKEHDAASPTLAVPKQKSILKKKLSEFKRPQKLLIPEKLVDEPTPLRVSPIKRTRKLFTNSSTIQKQLTDVVEQMVVTATSSDENNVKSADEMPPNLFSPDEPVLFSTSWLDKVDIVRLHFHFTRFC